MTTKILHQFTDSLVPGDAITDHAFLLQRWLRQLGFTSEIYTLNLGPGMDTVAHSITTYQPDPAESHLIYHHSIGSNLVNTLTTQHPHIPHIMIYHNITPPQFFTGIDANLIAQLQLGRQQLTTLKQHTTLALGVSAYNEAELRELGYPHTGVLPLPLDPDQYQHPLNPHIQTQFANTGPILFFLGRIVPNKRQDDLIKLFYCYRHIRPNAQLIIAGSPWLTRYVDWIHELTAALGLTNAVHFPGHISFADMTTYYQIADLYVSMSEHEGVGKPLLESMFLGTPVLAYASSAIPMTVDTGGILFHHKNYYALAELADLMIHDQTLNQKLITNGHARVQQFLPTTIKKTLTHHLTTLNLL
ncbi:MAG TPA: glycosyltransferase [Anaerolineae bacterium]|nr:glycosyltransferase [Anaerolineae bacterium]